MTRSRSAFPVAALALAAAGCCACAPGGLRLESLPPVGAVGATARFGPGLLAADPAAGTVTFELTEAAEVALVAVGPDGRVRPLYPYAPGESSRFTAGRHTVVVPVMLEWVPAPGAPPSSVAAEEMERQRAYQECLERLGSRRIGHGVTRSPGDTTSGRITPPATEVGTVYASEVEACGTPPTGGSRGLGSAGAFEVRQDLVVLAVSDAPMGTADVRRRLAGVRVRDEDGVRDLPRRIVGAHQGAWAGYYSRRH